MPDECSFPLHRASAEYRDFDLPPLDTKRWVTRRKAVRAGVISLQEVCRRYELSVEEFHAWRRAIAAAGLLLELQQARDARRGRTRFVRASR
jgi:hypothetical protein